MRIVTGYGETVREWLAEFHGVHVLQQPSEVAGVVDSEGYICGAFVVTWRNDTCVELHVYGRTSNDVWKWLFQALFARAERIEVRTRRDNKSIKRNAPKFGFKFEGVARAYYGPDRDDDAFVYGMTRKECRWLRQIRHKEHA